MANRSFYLSTSFTWNDLKSFDTEHRTSLFPAVLRWRIFLCLLLISTHINVNFWSMRGPASDDDILEVMMGPKGRKSNVKSCIFITIACPEREELLSLTDHRNIP